MIFKHFMIIIFAAFSLACMMLPQDYEGRSHQNSQEALIYFDNGLEDLILKVSPEIEGKDQLDHFCWLITVPNEPISYNTIQTDIFASLRQLKESYLIDKDLKKEIIVVAAIPADENLESSIELGKRVQVGEYDIQPIRGIGKNAFNGLNHWLKENSFPTEPESHMKYFIDHQFTFLCIKVKLKADDKINGSLEPNLDPLQITFKSEKPYYPMKYSSQQGNFSVNLYTLTTMPLDFQGNQNVLKRIDYVNNDLLQNINLAKLEKKETINEILSNKTYSHLYFNNIYCSQPNLNGAINN